MAEWIFNKRGIATMIFDVDCIRNNQGLVIAWIKDNNFYSASGYHKGWFEKGVFYDSQNKVIGFLSTATSDLPYLPGISGRPGMPGFAGRPGKPGFNGTPGRPGFGGYSTYDFEHYFD